MSMLFWAVTPCELVGRYILLEIDTVSIFRASFHAVRFFRSSHYTAREGKYDSSRSYLRLC
jgi:hypothetical protein